MNEILLMLQLFTVIPIQKEIPYDRERFTKTAVLLPVLGGVMGLLEGGAASLILGLFRPMTAVLLILMVDVFLTKGIHLDGLADTCDGLFSGRDRKTMLEIMKDSRLGAFGTLSLLFCLLLKTALLMELDSVTFLRMVLVLPVIGRSMMVLGAFRSVYARDHGFGGIYIGQISNLTLAIASATALFYSTALLGISGGISWFAVGFLILQMKHYTEKRLGGITGDVLGAFLEVSQLIYLLIYVLLAR
ncbi:adenosylcobinamide-GDP ribazoletransferase [Proteiniclasticum ruminis]|uniref:adenosylcobinamide-GDP ribazoletransferase n=1 Tax=Proteiniclasticum ruminis TaxID=398199 RepID=UPI0028AB8E47|nr:adenosylcobinamide-GDP ribazoletransferase [Proteiniclasticum ruminis]